MRIKTQLVTKESHYIEARAVGLTTEQDGPFSDPKYILHLEDEQRNGFCLPVSEYFVKNFSMGRLEKIGITVEIG